MLAPSTLVAPTWPIAGDVPAISAIIADQAAAIADQAVLIDTYQGVLNNAQNPPPVMPATGTGTATGTSLAVTGSAGTIAIGATVTGTGVPTTPPTTIVSQQAGTPGGDGTYITNQATTAAAAALTFTPPSPPPWPPVTDAPSLMVVQQVQTAVLRMQSALLQQYQELLNVSETPGIGSGP